MITTLRTGALAIDSAEYKFDANKNLTIRLTASAAHKLYGDVKITLSNVLAIDIYQKNGAMIADYFNRTLKFSSASSTVLEFSEVIEGGIAESETFITLTDSGSPIEANIDNASIDVKAGNYSFFLLDSADSDFSTSTISIKLLNVGKTGVDGIESIFDEAGAGEYLSINNQELQFPFDARISLSNDNSGVTNIPLIING